MEEGNIRDMAEHIVQPLFGSLTIPLMSSPAFQTLFCQPPGQEIQLSSCVPACLLFILHCLPSPLAPLSKNKQPCETCYSYFMDKKIKAQFNIAMSHSNMVVTYSLLVAFMLR